MMRSFRNSRWRVIFEATQPTERLVSAPTVMFFCLYSMPHHRSAISRKSSNAFGTSVIHGGTPMNQLSINGYRTRIERLTAEFISELSCATGISKSNPSTPFIRNSSHRNPRTTPKGKSHDCPISNPHPNVAIPKRRWIVGKDRESRRNSICSTNTRQRRFPSLRNSYCRTNRVCYLLGAEIFEDDRCIGQHGVDAE